MGAIVRVDMFKFNPIYKYYFSFFGLNYDDLDSFFIGEISRINDDGFFDEDIDGIHNFNKEEYALWGKLFVKNGGYLRWKYLNEDIVKKTDEDFKKEYKELLKKKEEERKIKEEEEKRKEEEERKRKEATICGKIKKFFSKIL